MLTNQHVVDIAEKTLCLLDFLSLAVIEIKFLLAIKRMYPCSRLLTQ